MPLAAVFTDLDGTLLEPDGSLSVEAARAVEGLARRRVPLLLLTSKTETELTAWRERLRAAGGSFENGAGVAGAFGREVLPEALPVSLLREAFGRLAAESGLELTPLDALGDAALCAASGLPPEALPAARAREWDLPFLAPPGADAALRSVALRLSGVTLTRGGRFWHLTGRHDKADALRLLAQRLAIGRPTAGLGDAANDAGFLRLTDLPVVVPPASGDSPLLPLVPRARLAPKSGGAGWAESVASLLDEAGP